MNLRGIIFFVIILFIYFGIHYFIYFSALNFFSIFSLNAKRILRYGFLFLAVSFIASSVLIRFSSFIIFRYYYIVSAFWMGLVFSLLIAIIMAWILVLIFKFLNIKLIIGSLAFGAVLIYGLYGAWNATHPVVNEIDIKITNLPESWQGKKAVHLSDVHLGRVQGVKFLEKVVAEVNNLKPDIIFITGDLFDGMGSDPSMFIQTLNKFKANTYFITGNHEVYLGAEDVKLALEDSSINVIDDMAVNIDGLQIIGVGYPAYGEKRDNNHIKNIPGHDPDLPSILLYHSPTTINTDNSNGQEHSNIYLSPSLDFRTAKEAGVNLQLSGHTHVGQLFPFNFIAKKIYGKYVYGLNTEGDFNINTSSGTGTWGPPIRTGSKSEIVLINLK